MTLPDNLPAPRGAPEDDQDREGWRVSDERAAEWVMRKLARFRERLTEQERLRAEYVGQLEDWWQEATGSLRQDIAWAEGLLTDWAFRLRHEDPDAKTQALPSGRVSTRWVPPHPQARDAGAVAAVLARAQHPAYERVVRARVDVDNRELAKIVRIADEWRVTLSCGCETSAWQVTEQRPEFDHPWPYRPDDHQPADGKPCQAGQLKVRTFLRGRVGVPVVAVERQEGLRIVPLDGVEIVPGRMSASVNPR